MLPMEMPGVCEPGCTRLAGLSAQAMLLPIIPLLWALRIRKEELATLAQEKQAQEEAALREMEELKRAEEEEQQRLAEKDRVQREQEEQEKLVELQLQVGVSAGHPLRLFQPAPPGRWATMSTQGIAV